MFAVTILKLAEGTGFEPVITISKTDALGPTKLTPNKTDMVDGTGIEPVTSSMSTKYSTAEITIHEFFKEHTALSLCHLG